MRVNGKLISAVLIASVLTGAAVLSSDAAAGLAGVGAGSGSGAEPVLATYRNPIVAVDSPDPDVIHVGSTYYAFTTGSALVNIPEYTATNLVSWSRQTGDALPEVPSWATPGKTWSPGVVELGGRWFMYYVITETSTGRQCISRASSTGPGGPYVDNSPRPLLCQRELSGSIDPDPFVDSADQAFLYWKSNGTGAIPAQLWGSALTPTGNLVGNPVLLATADATTEAGIIESPFMLQTGSAYVLFFSQNVWASSDYSVSYALCSSALGPCTPTDAAPILRSTPDALGPGGESVFSDADGQLWVAYDAWTAPYLSYAAGGERTMRVDPLTFVGPTPVVAGPSTTPSLVDPPDRVAGANRYATAAALARADFPDGARIVYIATGLSYPDALAAGPAAARAHAPILLVSAGGIPAATASELARLGANTIVVVGGPASVPDAVVSALSAYAPVTRVYGPDRYATAAAVSRATFPAGVSLVYVATGENFADALSGAAAAGVQGAPVLLTDPDSLPAVTQAELTRLQPRRIVVLGGTAAVSQAVASELAGIAPVIRLAGADRYATAAEVAAFAFPSSVPEVLLATGVSYPDALAASAAGRPVLLAPTSGTSPSEADELEALDPTRLVLVGGRQALPDSALLALGPG